MKEQTVESFQQGIYDMYLSMYQRNTLYYLLDEKNTEVDNIYNESQNKVYKEGINLLAKIELKPKLDEISIIGQQNKVEGQIKIPYLEMVNHNLHEIDLTTLSKGQIEVFNAKYDIINVIPETSFNNAIVKYIFEIRRKING